MQFACQTLKIILFQCVKNQLLEMEIFSLQNKAVWGAKNGKSCPCGRGWDSCFCAAWMFFAGELRVSARRNVISRAGGLRGGDGFGPEPCGSGNEARGLRSPLPPSGRARRVRTKYSPSRLSSAAERKKRLRIDVARWRGWRKIAPHGWRQCRTSCPVLPLAVADLRSSRFTERLRGPIRWAGLGHSVNGRQKILSLSLARAFCL